MPYELQPPTPGQEHQVFLESRQTAKRVIIIVLAVVGAGGLFLGLPALIGESIGLGPLGVGVICFAIMGLALGAVKPPRRLVFDNQKRVMWVEEQSSKDERQTTFAALPYAELACFMVREHQHDSDNRTTTYVVELLRTDGAVWSLVQSNNETTAQTICAELQARVDLDGSRGASAPGEPPPKGKFPAGPIRVEHAEGSSRIWWPERRSLRQGLVGAWAVGGFLMVIVAARGEMPPALFWLVAAALGLLIPLMLVYGLMAAIRRYAEVDITPTELTYRSPTGLLKRKGFTRPLVELDAVVLYLAESSQTAGLYLLKEQEQAFVERATRGQLGLGDLGESLKLMTKGPRIDAPELRVSEKLFLEQTLQELVAHHSGRQLR